MVPIPDHVPDDLVALYGASARRAVRTGRPLRARARYRARLARIAVRDPRAWRSAITTVALSALIAAALIGVGAALARAPLGTIAAVLMAGGVGLVCMGVVAWIRDERRASEQRLAEDSVSW